MGIASQWLQTLDYTSGDAVPQLLLRNFWTFTRWRPTLGFFFLFLFFFFSSTSVFQVETSLLIINTCTFYGSLPTVQNTKAKLLLIKGPGADYTETQTHGELGDVCKVKFSQINHPVRQWEQCTPGLKGRQGLSARRRIRCAAAVYVLGLLFIFTQGGGGMGRGGYVVVRSRSLSAPGNISIVPGSHFP